MRRASRSFTSSQAFTSAHRANIPNHLVDSSLRCYEALSSSSSRKLKALRVFKETSLRHRASARWHQGLFAEVVPAPPHFRLLPSLIFPLSSSHISVFPPSVASRRLLDICLPCASTDLRLAITSQDICRLRYHCMKSHPLHSKTY